MTDLLLVRHAIAEPAGEGVSDEARPLSRRGRQRFRAVVGGLRGLGVRLERVLHSPKLRAIQTAELLTPLLDGESEVTPLLAAPPDEALVALLGERLAGATGAVAVVGHQPWLGELVDRLVGPGAGAGIDWRKGGVVWLRSGGEDAEAPPAPGPAAGWRVRAVLPPGVLATR